MECWQLPHLKGKKVQVKLSLCLSKHHTTKTYWESGGIAPRILDPSARWRWMVSFTPRPLYPQGKSPWYPLDRRLGGLQNEAPLIYPRRYVEMLHPGFQRSLSDKQRDGPPAWGLGEGPTSPHRKKPACYEILHRVSDLEGSFEHGNEH
jgi:hypothetical protein